MYRDICIYIYIYIYTYISIHIYSSRVTAVGSPPPVNWGQDQGDPYLRFGRSKVRKEVRKV